MPEILRHNSASILQFEPSDYFRELRGWTQIAEFNCRETKSFIRKYGAELRRLKVVNVRLVGKPPNRRYVAFSMVYEILAWRIIMLREGRSI